MRSRIVALFISLAALAGAAGAQHVSASQAGAALSELAPARHGTLYRVAHQGSTAYLFGTIHVGQPAFYPLDARVTDALNRATRLAVELDVHNSESFQKAVRRYGYLPDGETLRTRISPATFALLEAALLRVDLRTDQVLTLKPWVVANLLLGLDLEKHGFQRRHGLEFFLLDAARAQQKTVIELESAEYQLSLFDDLTPMQQEQYLRETLTELASGEATRKALDLIDAWRRGDGQRYDVLIEQSKSDTTLSARFTQRVLLDRRNPEMADKIEALLKGDDTSFVGVGLLHLMGDTGLPTLLRQRGYLVEKVY